MKAEVGSVRCGKALRGAALAIAILALMAAGGEARADQSGDQNPVWATVGDRQFTQKEVDDAVLHTVSATALYDLRKQELDKMINEYLVNRAAQKAGLTPEKYLESQKKPINISDAEIQKFYNDHKAQIDRQTKGQSYDQVKPRIAATLQRRQEREQQIAMLTKLRSDAKINVSLQEPRFQVASENHPFTGAKDAAVTVVEFSDFQCPYCRAAESSVKQVRSKYGDQVKFVYMDFPLSFHNHSLDAARAARCAGEQDKFWQFHDALFADQSKLAEPDLKTTAAKLGLDQQKFAACFDKHEPDAGIEADTSQGHKLGITGTPAFFVNGRAMFGAQPPEKFAEVIDEELAGNKPPANQQANKAN